MLKKYIFLILIIFPFAQIVAQQQIKHDKTIYRNNDGTLYIQKSLPLYLWISNSPEDKDEMLLESDTSKNYTNPLYLDTEGLNTFRSPSAVDTITKQLVLPRKDIVFEVYADSKPPYTKFLSGNAKPFWLGKKLYYGKNLNLYLSSSDVLSGVNSTYLSINSSEYQKFTDTINLNEEKEYLLKYYSVDNVGNHERIRYKRFIIDLNKPISNHIIKGEQYENILSNRSAIHLSAHDSIAGVAKIKYSIDGQAEKKYRYPIKASTLSKGQHKLIYYAVDYVGNIEEQHIYEFFIDKTPPILVEEMMGNNFISNGKEFSSGRTKLKLTAIDNKAGLKGIYYSMNGEKFVEYDKPFYLNSISGDISIVSYALDNVNNKSTSSEKSTKGKSSYIDLSGPTLKYSFSGPLFKTRDSLYISTNTKIELKGYDGESGMEKIVYSIDNQQEKVYESSFSIETQGHHKINYTGFDNVGNTNIGTLNVVIDNKGPDIYHRFSILPIGKDSINNIDVYSSHVVLFLSATDARVPIDRMYYSEDGENFKMYTGLVDGFKRGKKYNLRIKSADKLGNSTESDIQFAIDNTGPEIFTRFSMFPIRKKDVNGEILDVYPSHITLFISVTNAFIAYDKIYYSINGAPQKLYNGIVSGFKQGADVTMKIRAIDKLGGETSKEIRFLIEE